MLLELVQGWFDACVGCAPNGPSVPTTVTGTAGSSAPPSLPAEQPSQRPSRRDRDPSDPPEPTDPPDRTRTTDHPTERELYEDVAPDVVLDVADNTPGRFRVPRLRLPVFGKLFDAAPVLADGIVTVTQADSMGSTRRGGDGGPTPMEEALAHQDRTNDRADTRSGEPSDGTEATRTREWQTAEERRAAIPDSQEEADTNQEIKRQMDRHGGRPDLDDFR